jgi:hypothetical protein
VSYKASMSKLDQSLACSSGLEDAVSDADSDCRSEGLWAAAGVAINSQGLRSPTKCTRPAWGSSRHRAKHDDDMLRDRHLRRSTRSRSASREHSRATAGLDVATSDRKRAIRRQVATLREGGGVFAGAAAQAFEALLDETLGTEAGSARELGVTRARRRRAQKVRSHSASPGRRGAARGRSRTSTPTASPHRGRATHITRTTSQPQQAPGTPSTDKLRPGELMSPVTTPSRKSVLPPATTSKSSNPADTQAMSSLDRLDHVLGDPPAGRTTSSEVKLATRRARLQQPSREALHEHSQSAWAAALNRQPTE